MLLCGSKECPKGVGLCRPGQKSMAALILKMTSIQYLSKNLWQSELAPRLPAEVSTISDLQFLSSAPTNKKRSGFLEYQGEREDGQWAIPNPGAGSDLASLSTRAEKAGDEYLINGRKTWTSDAMDCDYIFVLARTSDDKPKHQGISLVLVDMDQPGVEVHPIRLLSGASPFNETVFNNALADSADVIGGVDNGWSAGKRLLQFERSTHAGINTSGSQGGRNTRDDTKEIVLKYSPIESGRLADSATRARLLEFQMKKAAQSLTQKRTIEETRARAPGFTSSAVKLSNALIEQERDEMIVQVMGSLGIGWSGEPFSDQEIDATRTWLKQKSLTIAGGTKEVQLNIIAKRVLGLPD